jgi:Undecaprenyl-phosphate galactose phosphotransferase WbaP
MPTLKSQHATREDALAVRAPSSAPVSPAGQRTGRRGPYYVSQVLLTSAPLIASDLLAIGSAACLVFGAAYVLGLASVSPLKLLLFLSVTMPIVYTLMRLYPGTGLNPIVEFRQSIIATAIVFAAFMAASLVHDGRQGYASLVALTCLGSIVLVPAFRSVVRRAASQCSWWGQPLLIFGGNDAGWRNYHYFRSHPHLGLRPLGVVDDLEDESGLETANLPGYLGSFRLASQLADLNHVYWAVVAMPDRSPTQVRQVIERHAGNIPHVLIVSGTNGFPSLWNRAGDCAGLLGIHLERSLLLPLPRLVKRLMDLSIVIVGGIFCLPLIACIAILVKLSSPGPVFYWQERVGHQGQRFYVLKFRTMVHNAEQVLDCYFEDHPELREEWERDSKIKNDPRITPIGAWLRKTSLDELPQIWNVLTGEMSLVGPRPIMNSEFTKYSMNREGFYLYTKVLPGITGLWQVSGRSDTTYAERMDLDSYYVRNWSPWVDVYILLKTVNVVLCQRGAY